MELAKWDSRKMRETSALQLSDRKNMARDENWKVQSKQVETCLRRTPTTYVSPDRLIWVCCVLPVISFNAPRSASRLPNRRPSSAFDLCLPTIHTTAYLTFSLESPVLSDLLLPNLALWTSAYYPILFQGLSRSRAIVSPSAEVPYLLGVL